MSESDINAMIERMAREEQEDLDRAQGQLILDAVAAQENRRQGRAEDPLLEVLRRAHQASLGDDAP